MSPSKHRRLASRPTSQYDGFIGIDKPVGLSSFMVVDRLRRVTRVKRIGHSGTLDPFATGVMVVGIGSLYTKQLQRFQDAPKSYTVQMVLGIETDTLDGTGIVTEVTPHATLSAISETRVRDVLSQFLGELSQLPPQFSAKKVEGSRAYDLARQGETVTLNPVTVTIYSCEFIRFFNDPYPKIQFKVSCSKGTYIRSLVRDIATELGTVGYSQWLRRDSVGDVTLSRCVPFQAIAPGTLRPALFYEF